MFASEVFLRNMETPLDWWLSENDGPQPHSISPPLFTVFLLRYLQYFSPACHPNNLICHTTGPFAHLQHEWLQSWRFTCIVQPQWHFLGEILRRAVERRKSVSHFRNNIFRKPLIGSKVIGARSLYSNKAMENGNGPTLLATVWQKMKYTFSDSDVNVFKSCLPLGIKSILQFNPNNSLCSTYNGGANHQLSSTTICLITTFQTNLPEIDFNTTKIFYKLCEMDFANKLCVFRCASIS